MLPSRSSVPGPEEELQVDHHPCKRITLAAKKRVYFLPFGLPPGLLPLAPAVAAPPLAAPAPRTRCRRRSPSASASPPASRTAWPGPSSARPAAGWPFRAGSSPSRAARSAACTPARSRASASCTAGRTEPSSGRSRGPSQQRHLELRLMLVIEHLLLDPELRAENIHCIRLLRVHRGGIHRVGAIAAVAAVHRRSTVGRAVGGHRRAVRRRAVRGHRRAVRGIAGSPDDGAHFDYERRFKPRAL